MHILPIIGLGLLIAGTFLAIFPSQESANRIEQVAHIPIDRTLSGIDQNQFTYQLVLSEGQQLRVQLTTTNSAEISVYGMSEENPKFFLIEDWPLGTWSFEEIWTVPFGGTYFVDVRKSLSTMSQTISVYGDIYVERTILEKRTSTLSQYTGVVIILVGLTITAFGINQRRVNR